MFDYGSKKNLQFSYSFKNYPKSSSIFPEIAQLIFRFSYIYNYNYLAITFPVQANQRRTLIYGTYSRNKHLKCSEKSNKEENKTPC